MHNSKDRIPDKMSTAVESREQRCKVTQTRSSRGHVRITEVAVNGSYIMVENPPGIKSKTLDITDWTLKWTTDDGVDINYRFDKHVLLPGDKLKIYTRGYVASPGDNVNCNYVINDGITTWGTRAGHGVLYDNKMAKEASLKATVTYS